MTWKSMKQAAGSIPEDLKKRLLQPLPRDTDYNEKMGFKPGDEGYVIPYKEEQDITKPKIARLLVPQKYHYKEIDVNFNNQILSKIYNKQGFRYLFIGKTGTGKTELAKIIFNTIKYIQEPYNAHFLNARKMWQDYLKIMKSDNTDASEKLNDLLNYPASPVFFLDELGGEIEISSGVSSLKPQNFMAQIIADLYDYQKEHRDKTTYSIITTNLNSQEMAQKYNERCVDRIIELYQPVEFTNKTFREPQEKITFR